MIYIMFLGWVLATCLAAFIGVLWDAALVQWHRRR